MLNFSSDICFAKQNVFSIKGWYFLRGVSFTENSWYSPSAVCIAKQRACILPMFSKQNSYSPSGVNFTRIVVFWFTKQRANIPLVLLILKRRIFQMTHRFWDGRDFREIYAFPSWMTLRRIAVSPLSNSPIFHYRGIRICLRDCINRMYRRVCKCRQILDVNGD